MTTVRLKYIDRLKGFAILTVIMGHILFFSFSLKGSLLQEIIGSFHMPLFMFLSGMVANVPNIRKTMAKAISFMMPMVVVGLLFIMYEESTISSFINSPFKHSYWYLYVLTVFYILLYLVQKVQNRMGGVIFSVIIWGGILVVNYFVSGVWNDKFSIWIIKQYWPFFIAGYFFTQFKLTKRLMESNWLYTIALILYCTGFWIYTNITGLVYYPVAFAFIIAIMYLFAIREHHDSFIENHLEYLGQHTLDIYIYHMFIINIITLPTIGHWLENTGNLFIELLLCIVCSVIVGYTTIGIGKIVRRSQVLHNIIYGKFGNKLLLK